MASVIRERWERRILTHLAVKRNVAASTQNQAKSALLYLYREVLEIELPWLDKVMRPNVPKRLPVVLSVSEVRSVLAGLSGHMHWLLLCSMVMVCA